MIVYADIEKKESSAYYLLQQVDFVKMSLTILTTATPPTDSMLQLIVLTKTWTGTPHVRFIMAPTTNLKIFFIKMDIAQDNIVIRTIMPTTLQQKRQENLSIDTIKIVQDTGQFLFSICSWS